jgi:hypothetical protein
MVPMLDAELIAFGLTAREAQVYLTLLRLGEAPASVIAKRSGLPRLSAYSILDKLSKKCLLNFYEKRRKRFYRVNPPHSFLKYCDDQIASIQAKRSRVEGIFPKLCSYSAQEEWGEGVEGRLSFIRDRNLFKNRSVNALKSANTWMVFHDGLLWPLISEIQSRSTLMPQCLIPFSEKRRVADFDCSLQVRCFPNALLGGDVNIMLLGFTVMFVIEDSADFFAVEIENKNVAIQLRMLFSFLWKVDFFDGL